MMRASRPDIKPRVQLGCQWSTDGEARAIREFKARLALDGLTFKGWLGARIAEYLRRPFK